MTAQTRISHIKFVAGIIRHDPFQNIGHLPLGDVDLAISFLKAESIVMVEVTPGKFEPTVTFEFKGCDAYFCQAG